MIDVEPRSFLENGTRYVLYVKYGMRGSSFDAFSY